MSELASRIAGDLWERTQQVYGRVERRFDIERFDEPSLDWLNHPPSSGQPSCRCVDASVGQVDAIREVARLYREALWADADVIFQVWVEKDASENYAPRIAGLFACQGFATLTFIHSWAAATIEFSEQWQGCEAVDDLAKTLANFWDEPILAQRLAVMPEEIAIWPTRLRRETGILADVDLPTDFDEIVPQAIEDYLPREKFKILRFAQENDRELGLSWHLRKWRSG